MAVAGMENEDGTEVLVDQDVNYEVVDDTPEKDKGRKPLTKEVPDPTDDELENYSEKVKGRIADITHKMHDERRAKEQLLREQNDLVTTAQRILAENKALREHAVKAGNTNVDERVGRIKAERMALASQLRTAHEAGDTDKIVEIGSKMAELAADEKLAGAFKQQIPLQEETDVVPSRQEVPRQRPPQSAPDPRAVRWMKENAWFGTDEEMTARAYEIHYGLVNSGVDPRNEDYYERLNARLQKSFPDKFGEGNDERETPARRPTSVVASVSRTPTKTSTKVTLTQSQANVARRLGVPLEEYAKQLMKEQANG